MNETIPMPDLRPEPGRVPASCILALDLGTTTGWALRGYDGLITSGTVSFRPGRYDGGGMRLTGCRVRSRRSGSKRSGGTPARMRRMCLEVSSRR